MNQCRAEYLPNPDRVEVLRAGPQLLDGVPPGADQLVEARAQVAHVVLEIVLLDRRRVLLERLGRHLVIVRPVLQTTIFLLFTKHISTS